MKILLLGEYSNLHATLAEGLRTLGHEVTVASNGDFWKEYPRDISLVRTPGKLGGIKLLARIYTLLPRLTGYDIVQLINPMFLELKAQRIYPIYQYLRHHNKRIILGGFGMDHYWVRTCTSRKHLRYSDFNIGDQLRTDTDAIRERQDWIGTPKEKLNIHIAEDCDYIVTCLYEYWTCYHAAMPHKTAYIPLPITISQHKPIPTFQPPLKLFIGINKERSQYKGTDIMLRAAENVVRKHPDKLVLLKAESVPYAQYEKMMDGCDAILDQLYSYTPSMNSLLAMSKGIICIGGGEPENYQIIGEKQLRPIINVTPDYQSVFHEIEQLALHPERIAALKQQSMKYVKKHHDHIKVAREYEELYKRTLA